MTEPEVMPVVGPYVEDRAAAHLTRRPVPRPRNFAVLPPPPQVTEVKVMLPRVATHACAGFAMFATWWLIGMIVIPAVDGNRLSWIHIAVAAVGVPIAVFLWWVSWRVSVEASWQPRERLREPRR